MKTSSKWTFCITLAAVLIGLGPGGIRGQSREDIRKLRKLYADGARSYRARQYNKSIEAFSEFLKILPENKDYAPDRAQAHYNIACNFSLLSDKKNALGHLGKALKLGFSDFDTLERDKDLDPVRNDSEFSPLVEKYKKIQAENLQEALDFNLKAVDGTTIAKKDFLGKVLVVDLWGTWCPPCRMEIPHFIDLMKKYEKDGLRIVGLNYEKSRSDHTGIVKNFIEKNNVNYPCALGPRELLQAIPNFSGFPTTLFFGRDGKFRKMVVGLRDLGSLERIVLPLLKEEAPDPAQTKKKEEAKTTEKVVAPSDPQKT